MPRAAAWALGLVMALPTMAAAQEITGARYADPTTRYAHGVLGDAVEWGTLRLTLRDGTRLRAVLPEDLVFEDIAPRLFDLDGDGRDEVITVEASLTQGARLSVWGVTGDGAQRIAATPFIGTAHRWLAPVGAADLDGDGWIEIAYVDRPHLNKTLRLWRFRAGRLSHVADRPFLTNHKIGWDFIPGGIRQCPGRPPEIITALGDWKLVMATRFGADGFTSVGERVYRGPESLDAALACPS